MGRILGLDFGSKTTGTALSDPLKTIASPFETIKRDKEGKLRPTLRRIVEIAVQNDVELIVLGEPLNMDDTRGERAEKSAEFKKMLEHRLEMDGLNIPVVLWDERLSTVGADEILEESGIVSSERKQYIDKIAAALILEDYMNNSSPSR
ncbi:MAG: Holliday junction resolvase RuvX [Lachnospiraceae bacterium]|nr:Holliday junction resolvase RuvX [Lachnospiraceae bacterium]